MEPQVREGAVEGFVATVVEETAGSVGARSTVAIRQELALFAKIAIWQFDIASNKAMWMDGTSSIFGGDDDEGPQMIDGVWGSMLVHSEDREVCRRAFRRAISGEGPYDVEFRISGNEGVTKWVHAAGKVQRNARTGAAERMYGFMQDITEKKVAELKAIESRKMLQNVIDNSQ